MNITKLYYFFIFPFYINLYITLFTNCIFFICCRSGLGNHYGTLSGPIGAFSPVGRPGKEYKAPGKNVITNPGKHGTGYGYVLHNWPHAAVCIATFRDVPESICLLSGSTLME